jgi:hypothetical protein
VILAKEQEEDANIRELEAQTKKWLTESTAETERLSKQIDEIEARIRKTAHTDADTQSTSSSLVTLTVLRNELRGQLDLANQELTKDARLTTYVAGGKAKVRSGRNLSNFATFAGEVPFMKLGKDFDSKMDSADDVIQDLRDVIESDDAGATLGVSEALAKAQAEVASLRPSGEKKQQQAKTLDVDDEARVKISKTLMDYPAAKKRDASSARGVRNLKSTAAAAAMVS